MRYFLIIFSTLLVAQSDCVDGRYLDSVFDVDVSYGIEYGQNINEEFLFGNEYTQTLYMDV